MMSDEPGIFLSREISHSRDSANRDSHTPVDCTKELSECPPPFRPPTAKEMFLNYQVSDDEEEDDDGVPPLDDSSELSCDEELLYGTVARNLHDNKNLSLFDTEKFQEFLQISQLGSIVSKKTSSGSTESAAVVCDVMTSRDDSIFDVTPTAFSYNPALDKCNTPSAVPIIESEVVCSVAGTRMLVAEGNEYEITSSGSKILNKVIASESMKKDATNANGEESKHAGSDHTATSEEEDFDELFRVERERLGIRASVGGGERQHQQRPTSLPVALNRHSTLIDASRSRRRTATRAGLETGSNWSTSGPTSLDRLREWSISTYHCTRQALSERLGLADSVTTTSNTALALRVTGLREARNEYKQLSSIAMAMAIHLEGVVQAQRDIARTFTALSIECADLSVEFSYNAEINDALYRNGPAFVDSLRQFVAGINTLCYKTIDDTLTTAKNYETARLEYDAYRSVILSRSSSTSVLSAEQQRRIEERRTILEKLQQTLDVKLQLVESNRLNVMKRLLILFRNSLDKYFTGNCSSLELALKPFLRQQKPVSVSTPHSRTFVPIPPPESFISSPSQAFHDSSLSPVGFMPCSTNVSSGSSQYV